MGGGPGRYALWIAELGYRVVHRDLLAVHVEQLSRAAGGSIRIDSAVADARELLWRMKAPDAVLLSVRCITLSAGLTGCGPWPSRGG